MVYSVLFSAHVQFHFHCYVDSLSLATLHLITSSSCVIQDAEERGLPDSEDNSPQELNETSAQDTKDSAGTQQDTDNRIYLDLVPVRSFLHTSCGGKAPPAKETSGHSPVPAEEQKDPSSQMKEVGNKDISVDLEQIALTACVIFIFCALISRSFQLPALSQSQHL